MAYLGTQIIQRITPAEVFLETILTPQIMADYLGTQIIRIKLAVSEQLAVLEIPQLRPLVVAFLETQINLRVAFLWEIQIRGEVYLATQIIRQLVADFLEIRIPIPAAAFLVTRRIKVEGFLEIPILEVFLITLITQHLLLKCPFKIRIWMPLYSIL